MTTQVSIESLRFWSHLLLWVSIILPVLAALAIAARYYVERYEKKLSAQMTAAEIQQAKEDATFARSEVADAREKQQQAEAALRQSLAKLEGSATEAKRAAEALAALKRTPPKVNAYLATSERTGELLVVMDAENLVPFRARWVIVTEKDRIIAGIMIEDQEIHPAEDRKRFTAKASINPEQVANDYVELRFRYASVYAAEVGNLKELSGEVIQKYRYRNGKVHPW
jgi:hypothetical protein